MGIEEEKKHTVHMKERIGSFIKNIKGRQAFLILMILLTMWLIVVNLQYTVDVSFTADGYEIEVGNPEYAKPVSVRIDGKVYRRFFKDDYFSGSIEFTGYLQSYIRDRRYDEAFDVIVYLENVGSKHFPNNISLIKDSKPLDSNTITFKSMKSPMQSQHIIKTIIFNDDITAIATYSCNDDNRYIIVCPAKNREEALISAVQIYDHAGAESWLNDMIH